MRLKVFVLPDYLFYSVKGSMSYFPKTSPGIKMPMISETLRMSVRIAVTVARLSALNQLAEIFA